MKLNSKIKYSRGIGVISALVGLALASGLAFIISVSLQRGFAGLASLDLRMELVAIRSSLISQFDCEATKSAIPDIVACSSNQQLVQLIGRRGKILITNDAATPTQIGRWTLRATCKPDGVYVHAARPKPGVSNAFSDEDQDYYSDKLTGKVQKWSNSPLVLTPSTSRCANTAQNAVPSPTSLPGGQRTPGGQCWVTQSVYSDADGSLIAGFRTKKVSCPTEYSVAIASTAIPSCNAKSWTTGLTFTGGIPTGAYCSQMFLNDMVGGEIETQKRACDLVPNSYTNAVCQLTCCNL